MCNYFLLLNNTQSLMTVRLSHIIAINCVFFFRQFLYSEEPNDRTHILLPPVRGRFDLMYWQSRNFYHQNVNTYGCCHVYHQRQLEWWVIHFD